MPDRLFGCCVVRGLRSYAVLSIFTALFSLVRNYSWFHSAYMAARGIHERMFYAMLRAPMAFFHANPHGRCVRVVSCAS